MSGESGEPCDLAYATVAEYRASIGKQDDGDEDEICNDLTAMSRFVDRVAGTVFLQSTMSEQREYIAGGDGSGTPLMLMVGAFIAIERRSIRVDPIADPEITVTVNDVERTDVELRPLNADKGPEPQPWTILHSRQGFWPGARVKVDAIFGWPEIPTGIKAAVIQLTAIWRLESPRATTRIAEGMNAVIGTSQQAQNIVDTLVAQYGPQVMVA